MLSQPIVITGLGAVSPFGVGVEPFWQGLTAGRSAVMTDQARLGGLGLRSKLCGLVGEIASREIPRQFRRTMSRMSQYAWLASREALRMAELSEDYLHAGRIGIVVGSTIGSVDGLEEFFRPFVTNANVDAVKSTLFFKVMNHSVAANLAQAFACTGPLLAPSAACATGCQALGLGAMLIASNQADAVLCGGCDEYHPLTTATFDIMNAASTGSNHAPQSSPRPFDASRDGVVCSEGAGVLLLESQAFARKRGAIILGELLGYGTNVDPGHIAHPSMASIAGCMRQALQNAGIAPSQVGYINAHATATLQGDVAEGLAIEEVFGSRTPVSALKGYFGHAMAASGSLEAIACVKMMQEGLIVPTKNLATPDPDCGNLNHILEPLRKEVNVAVKNNFALGGVNTVVLFGSMNR